MVLSALHPLRSIGRLARAGAIPIEVAAAVTLTGWCGMWAEALGFVLYIPVDLAAGLFFVGLALITVSRRTVPRGLFWRR